MRFAISGGLAAMALAIAATPALFEHRGSRSGIEFTLRSAATPEKHQIETMVAGVAVFDYDNDGYADLYFTNGAAQPSLEKSGPSFCNRLYRNRRDWTFEDVTGRAGVCGHGFSIAAATADYDNDGFADLFVAGVNRNTLYRNLGDGRFEDVTAKAGIANSGRWAVSAAWLDYNNDSHLDLFVSNYVEWDPATEPFCGDPSAYRTYCHPKYYRGLPNTLHRNNGDGTFTDVSRASGIAAHTGKGMGVAVADYDGDGRIDVFVANDTVPNFLFRNQGDGTFKETAFQAGVAMNDDGRALSSMGADFRDIDNDGRPDLFVSALANETFPLYRNRGKGLFSDVTYQSRIGAASMPLSGWGAGVFDFDNDGRKDIFIACGDVQTNTELFSSRKSEQPNLVMLNRGDGTFSPNPVTPPAMHRGAAFADFDLDGRIDAAVTVMDGAPVLLRNVAGTANHWLSLRLKGSRSNRDAIGAGVRIVTSAGEQWNHLTTSVGYASSSDKPVHFGLGREDRVRQVEIRWPSGMVQKLEDVEGDRYLDVAEP